MSVGVPIQRVIFSRKPLNGYICVDNHFKIFPVHQWMNIRQIFSRVEDLVYQPALGEISYFGPPYPLHLEVEVRGPDEITWFKDGLRLLDRYEKIAALLIPGIELATHESNLIRWSSFYERTEEGVSSYYGITQYGVSINGIGSFHRYVSEGGKPASAYISQGDFYDALPLGEILDFPYNLSTILAAYSSLCAEQRANFDRAAFLFQQGEFLRKSRFEALVSYASSVECLLIRDSKKCDSCGQKKFGIARKFEDFMSEFAAVSPSLISKRRAMYSIRSKAAHGVNVHLVDRGDDESDFDPNNELFSWLVRKGLVKWLTDQGGN